jgi:hypothetical protein
MKPNQAAEVIKCETGYTNTKPRGANVLDTTQSITEHRSSVEGKRYNNGNAEATAAAS